MLLQKAASERRLQSANLSLHMPLARGSDGLVKRNSDRNARAAARSSSAGRPRTADSMPESRRSLTPKRSRDTTPLRDAVPVEKRRKFKEKLDEQIKISIESLSAKISEDWFNKLQNTLNSELHHAEQTLQREVEVLINKSSRDLFGKLRDHVFRVVDENCARKGMQVPTSHLQSADFNLNINKFRASSAINLDKSHLENIKLITSEVGPVSIDIETDADLRQIDSKLNDALGRYVQDLEDRMKEYTHNVVAKEVDARIQKTRQLITSELQESLADMASQLRGKLEIIAQARASEISEGSVEVETPKSDLKQGEASYSFDTYNFKFDEPYLKTPDSSSTPKSYDLIEGLVRNSQMASSKSHESFRSPQQPQGRKKSAKAKPASRPSPPRTKILDTLKQFLKSESNFT
jgi:hypothetical protein